MVEQLDIKQELFERVEACARPGRSSRRTPPGFPIAALAQGRSPDFRRHFIGTHFFNPPRYLRLLELIPTPETDPSRHRRVSWFADHRLGKGVVVAKDTPNFIANHIGLFGVIQMLRALESGEYTIEEIDAITGPALGRPRSATFRTMDIAGIDILGHVARNLAERLPDDERARATFALPPLVDALIERGWVGEKAGQGFYNGRASEILTLDPASMSYRAEADAAAGVARSAQRHRDVGERVKTLFLGRDKVGAFLRATLGPRSSTPRRWRRPSPTPSTMSIGRCDGDSAGSSDRSSCGMRSASRNVLDATEPSAIPPLVASTLENGARQVSQRVLCRRPRPTCRFSSLPKIVSRSCRHNPGASLVDLGDGVLAVEFHSKMNAIGGDTVQMLNAGVKEAAANFAAMVIGNEATDFSAGANLMLVLLEAQEGNWDEIDLMVRTFQQTNLALKYAEVPVIVAPAGLTLGGGCEIVMHGDRAQAAAEAYIGLVEVGVGLIPGGGGTKEMLVRAMRASAGARRPTAVCSERVRNDRVRHRVDERGTCEAARISCVSDDGITMNRERLMADAKALALDRVREGYQRQQAEPIPVGGEGVEAALKLGVHLAWRAGRISDHDALIGRTLAHVLAGGTLPCATTVSEAQLLDLEREAFLETLR